METFIIGIWDDDEYDNLSYYSDISITVPKGTDFEKVKKALMDARFDDDIDACSIDEVCDYVCEKNGWKWDWFDNKRAWAWNFAENETLGD